MATHPPKCKRVRWLAKPGTADLLRRVYLVDVLTCSNCKGVRQLLAFISDRGAIFRILSHLGLATAPPTIAPARAPPTPTLPF